ncbi:hypothetical protein [Pseudomonas sp. S1(2024)]|uniref:hypothetical protein n=1 Tax=Pseudomonas sp. S1(2024) TaxID=3390191 RepID=UPI00397B4C02
MSVTRKNPKPAAPTTPCPEGMCLAGHIGSKEVMVRDWAVEALKFEGMIELWNEATKRHALPHIGFKTLYKFCPACGSPIDTGFVPGGVPELPLTADLKKILALNDTDIAEQGAKLLSVGVGLPDQGVEQRVAVQHWLMKQYFRYGREWRTKTGHLISTLSASGEGV